MTVMVRRWCGRDDGYGAAVPGRVIATRITFVRAGLQLGLRRMNS